MGPLLLITDDPGRSARLMRDLDPGTACRIHDLRADAVPIESANSLVADVADLGPATMQRLLRLVGGRAAVCHSSSFPDLVRLVTVCDIYGALIERRPYKPPMAAEKAYAILTEMKGRLDPALVDAFQPLAAAFPPVSPATREDSPPCTSP